MNKSVKQRDKDCSLMVAEMPRIFRILFRDKRSFFVPCWVIGEVDISDEESLLKNNNSLKSDIRRLRKNKLQFEVTNDPNQLHNFYYHMYLPHISKAHGNRAFIVKFDYMKKKFKNCDLLLIKKEKEFVAGILIAYTRNGARLWSLGVKDGNLDYVKAGAIGALDFFAFQYLKEKGYKKVNYGGSRAFLNDGTLQFKKKWRIQIDGSSKIGFLIKPLHQTGGIKGFFLNNPLIFIARKRFNGAIFVGTDQILSGEDYKKICKYYNFKGLGKLYIYFFGVENLRKQKSVPSEFSDIISLRSAEGLF